MTPRTLKVAINGTGFAGDYTVRSYGMVPHRNGVTLDFAGVVSGRLENAERFAKQHGIAAAFSNHAEMLETVRPDVDSVCSANFTHAPYVKEAAEAGVPVIVLEKPPVIWPGYPEGRDADVGHPPPDHETAQRTRGERHAEAGQPCADQELVGHQRTSSAACGRSWSCSWSWVCW